MKRLPRRSSTQLKSGLGGVSAGAGGGTTGSRTNGRCFRGPPRSSRPLRSIADALPPKLTDLPKELTDRFVGKNHTYLLKVYARGNIWNMDQLEKFVHAVESGRFPRHRPSGADLLRVAAHAVELPMGRPLCPGRRPRCCSGSIPQPGTFAVGNGAAGHWVRHDVRLLGWLDIPFNPANMIVLPLILGIGVDHGVHPGSSLAATAGPFRPRRRHDSCRPADCQHDDRQLRR